jgi:general secretion pathway protein K
VVYTVFRVPIRQIGIAQNGIALITVLLILVFLSVFAIAQAEKQNISILKVSNLVESEQAFQIAIGGEQWAIKMLEQDIKTDSETGEGTPVDHSEEAWANLGPGVKVEGTESFMRVSIQDMHGLFNVNNLVQGKKVTEGDQNDSEEDVREDINSDSDSGEPESAEDQNNGIDEGAQQKAPKQPSWYSVFQSLLVNLGLEPELADTLMDWVDADDEVSNAEGAEDTYYLSLDPPYLPANQPLVSIGELSSIKGFTPEVLRVLGPFITALPVAGIDKLTKININTASSVVLSALVSQPGVTAEALAPLIEMREAEAFESIGDFSSAFTSLSSLELKAGSQALLDVKGEYFLGHSCALTGKVELSQLSLLHKDFAEKHVSVVYRLRMPDCPELVAASNPEPSS